jgi:hypothetical protein
MPEILVGEEHSQVYDVWKARGTRDLAISHIDFHCDMRGLLLDRKRAKAYFIDSSDPRIRVADSGNFIAHAIVEGIVTSMRWVHDPFGGRLHDVGTVKYETDFSARRHRSSREHDDEVPLAYEELTFDEWDGLRPPEHLDIDWDGIAYVEYEVEHARRLMAEVLERDFSEPPPSLYLIRSPGYCRPERELFDEFVEGLEAKFDCKAQSLPPSGEPPVRIATKSFSRALKTRALLTLKRLGVHGRRERQSST